MGWTSTVTNKGYALQAKLLSTDKLNITRVVSGSGSCATTQLINQTAVTNIKQELTVDSLTYDKYGNARLKVTLNNINLSTSYGVSQIGIYAADPDEGEILYAITQADEAEAVPSISEQPNGFYCSWDFALTYSHSENVNVTIDPSNAISQDTADKRYVQLSKIGNNLSVDENGVLSANAQEITVDSSLSSTSTNPVQNNVVKSAIDSAKRMVSTIDSSKKLFLVGVESQGYTATSYTHDTAYVGTDGCLYSNNTKVSVEGHSHTLPKASASTLGGIKVGSGLTVENDGTVSATGTDVTIDSALSSSSTNPVQNKVVTDAIEKAKYTHPSYTAKSSGLYKVAVDSTGHVSGATPVTKQDIVDLGIPSSPTTYGEATASTAGLMSPTDKKKLDNMSETPQKYTSTSVTGNRKLFLVGAAEQSGAGHETFTNNGVYIGTDNCLYSNSTKVSVEGHSHSEYAAKSHTHSEYAAKSHTHEFSSLEVESISLNGLFDNGNFGVREPTDSEKNNLNGLKAAVLIGCQNKCNTTTASNVGTCLAVGYNNEVYSRAVALGEGLQAWEGQTVVGKYNRDTGTSNDVFIVGGGTSSARLNVFRVSSETNKCYGVNSFTSSGADYAEYMEWEDGNPNNEDRRGRMVAYALTDVECTVEDVEILHPDTHEPITVKAIVYEKMPPIRYANSFDECIGVVSGSASFIGNSASEDWNSRFLKDIYGESIKQAVLIPEETKTYKVKEIDEKTGEEVIVEKEQVTPEHWEKHPVINPHYDPEKEYVSREFRQEWDPVGMVGMVVVEDDGTCVVGGYCKPSTNGIGTAAETGYRVLQRMDNTHVRVLVR